VVLNCSRQWALLVAKARALLATAGEEKTRKGGHNRASVVLRNDSAIVGHPGKERYGRGFLAVSMLTVDGAARVDDELYRSTGMTSPACQNS
jgi:hypothetical protein